MAELRSPAQGRPESLSCLELLPLRLLLFKSLFLLDLRLLEVLSTSSISASSIKGERNEVFFFVAPQESILLKTSHKNITLGGKSLPLIEPPGLTFLS